MRDSKSSSDIFRYIAAVLLIVIAIACLFDRFLDSMFISNRVVSFHGRNVYILFLVILRILQPLTLAICSVLLFVRKGNYVSVGYFLTSSVRLLYIMCFLIQRENIFVHINITFYSISYFIYLASFALFGWLSLQQETTNKAARKIWYLPLLLMLICKIPLFYEILHRYQSLLPIIHDYANMLIMIVADILSMLFACLWLKNREVVHKATASAINKGKEINESTNSGSNYSDGVLSSEAYFGMFGHVLLLILVFIVWYYVWIYRTTKYLNAYRYEEPRNPTKKLLLCMFVPFYSIYWVYKSAQRIDRLAGDCGVASDTATICLILAIFIPIVPPILMQDKINKLAVGNVRNSAYDDPQGNTYERQSNSYQASQTNEQSQSRQNTQQTDYAKSDNSTERNHTAVNEDVIAQLRAYKELMDMGIVTKDEFEQKKRDLLGL